MQDNKGDASYVKREAVTKTCMCAVKKVTHLRTHKSLYDMT